MFSACSSARSEATDQFGNERFQLLEAELSRRRGSHRALTGSAQTESMPQDEKGARTTAPLPVDSDVEIVAGVFEVLTCEELKNLLRLRALPVGGQPRDLKTRLAQFCLMMERNNMKRL